MRHLSKFRNNHSLVPMVGFFDNIFDSFFDDMDRDFFSKKSLARTIPTDLLEKEDKYSLRLTLPRVSKEDIKISYDKDLLSVGVKKEEKKNERYFYREIYAGDLSRQIRLPKNSNPAEISASMKEGILTIDIPKTEPIPVKEITID